MRPLGLAADRLEYTLSNGLGATEEIHDLEQVKEIYQAMEVQKNEKGLDELGFKNGKVAEKFVHIMSQLSSCYITNQVKFSMQFLADILKKMAKKNFITKKDLYTLSEKEIIKKIENCQDDSISSCFAMWRKATKIQESDTLPENEYYWVSIKAKIRYSVPLVRKQNEFIRVDKISKFARQEIQKALNYQTKKYAYLEFKF